MLLDQPSIDRKDNDGHYTLQNCRYIELGINAQRGRSKSVLQYSLDNKFIREFKSQTETSNITNVVRSGITNCCLGLQKSSGNYKWEYKE